MRIQKGKKVSGQIAPQKKVAYNKTTDSPGALSKDAQEQA
jgi:hypothetical protein